MSPATVVPKTQKFELSAHIAGVAVDGFVPETESLERFAEELTARLEALEAKFESFQTKNSVRKSLRA
jgi:hypothetical protein